mgnify:CR=1 FL=1
MINVQMDRVHSRPAGLSGGLPAFGNQAAFQAKDGEEQVHPTGKMLAQPVRAGDRFILRSGGGYGDPLERDLARVEADVVAGYVSPAAAERIYDVVFRSGSVTADPDATVAKRKQMRQAGLPTEEDVTALVGQRQAGYSADMMRAAASRA